MKRLDNGLVEGIDYIYTEDGRIDWLKMVPLEYLYINAEKKAEIEKRLDKPFNEVQKTEVKANELIITISGIKHLLNLKGFKSSKIKIDVATPEYVAATCEIEFLPSENEKEQVFSASASAHFGNTKSWYKNYLVEAASNRAFCRAVRFYLGLIQVVSSDELGGAGTQPEANEELESGSPIAPKNIALKKIKELGFSSFSDVIKAFNKININKYDNYDKLDKVPGEMIMGLMGDLNKLKN